MNLKGNKIVITGGSRGIGLGLVERLINNNEILIVSRSEENLENVKKDFQI